MLADGATLLDVGGESTRPGARTSPSRRSCVASCRSSSACSSSMRWYPWIPARARWRDACSGGGRAPDQRCDRRARDPPCSTYGGRKSGRHTVPDAHAGVRRAPCRPRRATATWWRKWASIWHGAGDACRRAGIASTGSSSTRASASARRSSTISHCCETCRGCDRWRGYAGRHVTQEHDRRGDRAVPWLTRAVVPRRRLLAVQRGADIVRAHDVAGYGRCAAHAGRRRRPAVSRGSVRVSFEQSDFRNRRHSRTGRPSSDHARVLPAPGLGRGPGVLPSGESHVLIGKDTRISGYMLESVLESGLVSAGRTSACWARCRLRRWPT
jgi:hypothetical protein